MQKTVSAQYLEKFIGDSHSTQQEDWSCLSIGQQMTLINFEVTMSKVTEAVNAKEMSVQYLEKFMSYIPSTSWKNWSWSVDKPYEF